MRFFFFNDTATTEIYTLSLHDALPISDVGLKELARLENLAWLDLSNTRVTGVGLKELAGLRNLARSEEHTSELQSQSNLVCRLLLEKKTAVIEREYDCSALAGSSTLLA